MDHDLPAPPPETDDRGCRLRTGVGPQRRALARRTVRRPAVALLGGLVVFVLLGLTQPTVDGAFVPRLIEDLHAGLPLGLSELDLLQLLVLPFLGMALYETVRGVRYARRTRAAELRIDAGGRLLQTDGETEHIDLDHLLHVDVAPNRAFTDLNERIPVGSVLVLRLTDATGGEVDVNPGMWEQEATVVEVIRHYAWHGHAAITPEAAERYRLPVRGRHGEAASAEVGPALEGLPPRSEAELEAPLRARGIEVERGSGEGDGPDDA